jgi:ADP-ribose pyrophosphatase YjhB (NUDIX family)
MAKKLDVKKDLLQVLEKGEAIYQKGLSIDCVIFGFHEGTLKTLLIKLNYLDKYALPGGFIYKNETVEDAAYRVLHERTGVTNLFLQQFHVFSDPNRSDSNVHQTHYKEIGLKIPKDNWLMQRFVTIGFFALIDFTEVTLKPNSFEEGCQWIDINSIEKTMMDHQLIIQKALETLRTQLAYQPVGRNLLPKKFTMPELQKLYECILDSKLDRRNFQRKMLSFGILNKLNETRKGGAHKAPFLYTFNDKKYQKALKEGLYGSW